MGSPVWELRIIFAAASEDEASELLEAVTEFACRQLGGHGEGDEHVCVGFICASVGLAPDPESSSAP